MISERKEKIDFFFFFFFIGRYKQTATKESTTNILPPKLPASEHISIATADSTVTLSSLVGDAKISPPPPHAPKHIFAQSNHGIPSSASSALTYENSAASSFKTPASSSRSGAASQNRGNVNSEQSFELPEIDSEYVLFRLIFRRIN